MFGVEPHDEFGVARKWAWPLLDELTSTPDALTQLEAADAWKIGEHALHTAVNRFAGYTLPFEETTFLPAKEIVQASGYFDAGAG